MKFKANQTVSIKVGKDMITLQKGEEKELPESFGLNASLEVVESKQVKAFKDTACVHAEHVDDKVVEVKKAPLTKKASKKVSKK